MPRTPSAGTDVRSGTTSLAATCAVIHCNSPLGTEMFGMKANGLSSLCVTLFCNSSIILYYIIILSLPAATRKFNK